MQIITIFVAKFCTKKRVAPQKIVVVMAPFDIFISSSHEEFWKFNVVVMVDVDREGRHIQLFKDRIDVAPVGSFISEPPVGYKPRDFRFHTDPANVVTIYIYLIPHTLPRTRDLEAVEPVELRVEALFNDSPLYAHTFEISPWSGDNIEIELIEPGYGGHSL